MSEIDYKEKIQLKSNLKLFFEAYHKTKIIDFTNDGIFKTHILLSKNKNKTFKEKLINYKLLRVNELIFDNESNEPSIRNLVIAEFLIDELLKYVQKSIKKT